MWWWWWRGVVGRGGGSVVEEVRKEGSVVGEWSERGKREVRGERKRCVVGKVK